MRILAIASQKGGSGKTTLAGHLAVAADHSGEGPVAIIDTDPQGSLASWWNAREAPTPLFAAVDVAQLGEQLAILERQDIALTALAQLAAKPCVATQLIVPRHPAVWHLLPPRVEHLQALRVPRVIPHLRRDVARRTPWRIPDPVLGQGQAEVEQGMVVARDVPHEHPDLAIVDLAPVATPLALDTH